MQLRMELILVIGLATLASSAAIAEPDPIVSDILASELDPDFPTLFQGILQQSIDNAVNDIGELRPANHTVAYKQPNGNMQVPVVAVFGAMTIKGINYLKLEEDVILFKTERRNLYLGFDLIGQPLKFNAHVTVSSMGIGAEFQVFGKISFKSFYALFLHQYDLKPSITEDGLTPDKLVIDLDAFVPNWLNRTTFISESVKKLLPLTKTYIVQEFCKHVLRNLNLEEVEDTLDYYRKSRY